MCSKSERERVKYERGRAEYENNRWKGKKAVSLSLSLPKHPNFLMAS
jgi:hypothetical protein